MGRGGGTLNVERWTLNGERLRIGFARRSGGTEVGRGGGEEGGGGGAWGGVLGGAMHPSPGGKTAPGGGGGRVHAVRQRVLGDANDLTNDVLNDLAWVALVQGDPAHAKSLFEQILAAIGPWEGKAPR